MAEIKKIAPCGLFCAGCRVYKSSDDPKMKKKIASDLNVNVEDVHCEGCRTENGDTPISPIDEKCPTYQCVKEKGLDFCHECEDFPCSRLYTCLNSPKPHNSKITNLLLISKNGLDWFLKNADRLTKLYYKGTKDSGGSKLKLES